MFNDKSTRVIDDIEGFPIICSLSKIDEKIYFNLNGHMLGRSVCIHLARLLLGAEKILK